MRWFLTWAFQLILSHSYGQLEFNAHALDNLDIENIEDVNSRDLEFSPYLIDDGLLYISSSENQARVNKRQKENYFQLAAWCPNKEVTSNHVLQDLFDVINSGREHIGPISMTDNKKLIFFTKSHKFRKKGKKTVNRIYWSMQQDTSWSSPEEFQLNNDEYNVQHPALSPLGDIIVFSSNMDGGYGGYDLYISHKTNDSWDTPINLGAGVNSAGNELFPYLLGSEVISYSSDGRGGLGKLDLFVSIKNNEIWENAHHLGTELNSSQDDLGLVLNAETTSGFFSSDRKGGKGKDDIYKVVFQDRLIDLTSKQEEQKAQYYSIKAIVEDQFGEAVPDVKLQLIPFLKEDKETILTNFKLESIDVVDGENRYLMNIVPRDSSAAIYLGETDMNGQVSFGVADNLSYLLRMTCAGYNPLTTAIDGSVRNKEIRVLMEKIVSEEKDSTTIKEEEPKTESEEEIFEKQDVVIFDQIYYAFNSSTISIESNQELDKLALFLTRFPEKKVELTAYTDSRGQRNYNLELSKKRAEAAKIYLESKGILTDRIIAQGLGEKNIRNHCTNGVFCTEEEHEYNRRTEVRIVN